MILSKYQPIEKIYITCTFFGRSLPFLGSGKVKEPFKYREIGLFWCSLFLRRKGGLNGCAGFAKRNASKAVCVRKISSFFSSLIGWRRYVMAGVLGALAALAFAPFHLVPVLWLSFPALVFVLQGASRDREAFAIGWSFAFGHLVVCLHWIAGALFVDIESFWWAVPFAVAGLPALFAAYYGLAALLARRWGLTRPHGVLFFALCWFAADVARGHLFTGFPWDILGYAWAGFLPALQSVSLFGIEGLTLVTAFLAVLPAAIFVAKDRKKAVFYCSFALLAFAALVAWGQMRLAQTPADFVPGVRLRLVQPGLEQAMKWRAEQRMANLDELLRLSFDEPAAVPITHYIWPETATSFYLTEEPLVRSRIAAQMPADSVLLTGVVRRQMPMGEGDGGWSYYNSLIALDSRGRIVAGYDKQHLVPFGEYMPFRSVIPFRAVASMGSDFSAGAGVMTLRAPGLPPFSPLICYEAIFSGEVAEKADRPQALLNVTNDAWYEGTIGPAQHFEIARVRAIEEGLPLIRVANKGRTAVVDPLGRVVAMVGEKRAGFVDAELPRPLASLPFMSYQGVRAGWLTALGLLGLLFVFRANKRCN